MASTMVRPPGRRPPPPPPPPSVKRKPPPPPRKVPPPPPPPKKRSVSPSAPTPNPKKQRCILSPILLRDVNVFNKKHQVGEGTYGKVFVGEDKISREIVALKRINTEQEANGFPITAIREVKILKALDHENIVTLKEIVTSKEQGAVPKNVFMVFEYMEYDLTGILDTKEINLSQDHIKSWSKQLLQGTHYMHKNKVIHRDLKASNLLINERGELKIADWGLARSWNSEMKRLTKCVITLWYRPPELLLGCATYSPKIDMWSVGCIIAEMFRRSGLFKGATDDTQLDLIFRTCGHPTKEDWPNLERECQDWKKARPDSLFPNRLEEALLAGVVNKRWMTKSAMELIAKLLTMNPATRWSAQSALLADYFFEKPAVKKPADLAMNFSVASVHEWECRQKQLAAARK